MITRPTYSFEALMDLSPDDIGRLLFAMNGVLHLPDFVPDGPDGAYFAASVMDSGAVSAAIIEDQGSDPNMPTEGPETLYEHSDLAEKLAALSDDEAHRPYWYIAGWWDACGVKDEMPRAYIQDPRPHS